MKSLGVGVVVIGGHWGSDSADELAERLTKKLV